MNGAIADAVRDPMCTACPMHNGAQSICIVGRGNPSARVMVVGKMPDSPRFRQELEQYLSEATLDPSKIYYSSAIKCRNFDRDASNADVKKCRSYLDEEIDIVQPKFILALGNEALLSLTGKSGITKYRGQVFDHAGGAKVVPTISPSAVKRNPGQRAGFLADLHFFAAQVQGRKIGVSGPNVKVVDSIPKLKVLLRKLALAEEVAYDVETVGDGEWASDAAIVTLSMTLKIGDELPTYVVTLFHPESPFRRVWESVVQRIVPKLAEIRKRYAHNGKYDDKWLRRFGQCWISQTFDTLIAAHMIDENRPKGLKPLAQTLLGVRPWAISTKNLLETPLKKVILYNAKDTHYTWHLKQVLARQLEEKPRTKRIFTAIMMPANQVYTGSEMAGIWVDREQLATNTKIAFDRLHEIETKLMEHVPDVSTPENEEEARQLGWPTTGKKGKLADVNFNASKWARWWLFEFLELPVLERGKDKPNGDPGDPSMREGVLMELKDQHPAVEHMLARVEWQKITSSFLVPYADLMDDDDRIHTVFKPWGTVTGRTSSGKEDAEKITAQRGKRRGANLQQVPREILVRGVFGAPDPDYFVEFDYSQIELRIAAFIARELHMLHLYRMGADIHLTTAAKVTGLPESKVSGKVRKEVGKPVNFGFLYGMSWRKFIQTAFEKYGVRFTEEQARAFRESYFELFPGLLKWHNDQRNFVNKHGYAISPLGRIRHLPDINSPDKAVRHEAERQAINSPVQGMGSDMLQLGMVLVDRKLRKLGWDDVKILGTVHDALNLEVPPHRMAELLPLVKETMENLPLEQLFNVSMDIPIIADCKVGRRWGGATELTEEQVFDWNPELLEVAS